MKSKSSEQFLSFFFGSFFGTLVCFIAANTVTNQEQTEKEILFEAFQRSPCGIGECEGCGLAVVGHWKGSAYCRECYPHPLSCPSCGYYEMEPYDAETMWCPQCGMQSTEEIIWPFTEKEEVEE